jgi:hypothetical protein
VLEAENEEVSHLGAGGLRVDGVAAGLGQEVVERRRGGLAMRLVELSTPSLVTLIASRNAGAGRFGGASGVEAAAALRSSG